jgi:hypothetical protein
MTFPVIYLHITENYCIFALYLQEIIILTRYQNN